MAKKGSTDGRSAKGNGWGIQWVNYDLRPEDKERLEDPDLVGELQGFNVDDLVVQGFKYSLAADAKNSCYVASLTDKSDDSAFHNHCLTGRGATPAAARISLLYRHLVLADGDWSVLHKAQDIEGQIYL